MSTEISVDIAVDIPLDTRSIVGRHSVDRRSIHDRQAVETRSTVSRYGSRWSVDSRSTLGRDTINNSSRCVSVDIAFR